jgi:hypothetical protein
MTKPAMIAALLLVGLAGSAAAQQPAATDKWASLARLAPDTQIRVALSGGRTVGGNLLNATSDSLAVRTAAGQETLMRTEIKRVQTKGKGRRGRRTLIGLAIGAGAGLAIGAVVDHGDSGKAFNFWPNAGKVVFTPLGAIVGTIVGVAIPTGGWREVYRAP